MKIRHFLDLMNALQEMNSYIGQIWTQTKPWTGHWEDVRQHPRRGGGRKGRQTRGGVLRQWLCALRTLGALNAKAGPGYRFKSENTSAAVTPGGHPCLYPKANRQNVDPWHLTQQRNTTVTFIDSWSPQLLHTPPLDLPTFLLLRPFPYNVARSRRFQSLL